tara:strand:+ start:1164 stop:1562 length:399 start_codon:yes stop_codon:yes gene_type:complete
MASFAKIGLNGQVLEVLAVDNSVITDAKGVEQEKLGINFLTQLTNWPIWKKTSYNTKGGVHILGGVPFRKNHPGIDYTYDEDRNAFIPPKPTFNSWVLNEETCLWEAPVAYPDDGQRYSWNEETQQWDLINE